MPFRVLLRFKWVRRLDAWGNGLLPGGRRTYRVVKWILKALVWLTWMYILIRLWCAALIILLPVLFLMGLGKGGGGGSDDDDYGDDRMGGQPKPMAPDWFG